MFFDEFRRDSARFHPGKYLVDFTRNYRFLSGEPFQAVCGSLVRMRPGTVAGCQAAAVALDPRGQDPGKDPQTLTDICCSFLDGAGCCDYTE